MKYKTVSEGVHNEYFLIYDKHKTINDLMLPSYILALLIADIIDYLKTLREVIK